MLLTFTVCPTPEIGLAVKSRSLYRAIAASTNRCRERLSIIETPILVACPEECFWTIP